MRLVSKARMREYGVAEDHLHREIVANRWLGEFDWLLEPLWDVLSGKINISVARDDMRARLANRDETIGTKE